MIVCAAIKFEYNNIEIVVPCIRHSDGLCMLHDLGVDIKDLYVSYKLFEGFIDTRNKFYDRYEAFQHCRNCGQLPATVIEHKIESGEVELYSEDLY